MQHEALRYNTDFVRAYRRGKPYVNARVILYVNRNRVGHTRVGITASKKIGGAVVRNRARRVIRAALAQALPADVGGYDLVFVARGITPHLKSGEVAKAVARALQAAGLAGGGRP